MTNKKRQEVLDKEKWIESYECKEDQSGKMPYCQYCEFAVLGKCTQDEKVREISYQCATAFNRMKRR